MATRSGPYVPDAQRHTARLTLRLPPDVAAELRRRAVGHPGGLAGVVAELLGRSEPEEVP